MAASKVLDRDTLNYIHEKLYAPRIKKKEDKNFVPRQYSSIKKLIPVVLDLIQVDYSTWSALFRNAARDHNLLHHIDPTIRAPSLADNTIVTRRVDDDDTFLWRRQDALLLTWIYATISPYLLARIKLHRITNAMDAWARLRDVCQEYKTYVSIKKRRLFHKTDLTEDYDHGVDLISGLPDDVLIYVLILTGDMKTAGRTSILSKRWKHVWTHLMDLDFSIDPETIASLKLASYPQPEMYKFAEYLKLASYPQPEMDKFVEWVNRVMSANRAPYLDSLRIHMPLNTCYGSHIHNWVQYAFVKEVHHLELNFGPDYEYHNNCPRINFSDIFSTNPALILNTALKSLHLDTVIIKGPLIQWVLTNCLNLQHLSLHNWSSDDDAASSEHSRKLAASSEHSRELVVSSLGLKHLEFFQSLWPLKFRILRVFAPNLTSFIFGEADIDVEYRSIPSLVDATFVGAYLPDSDTLSGMASQLEKLSVNWYKLRSAFSGFPTFANLQQLEIVLWQQDYDLILSTSLIEACPLLHTFKLKLMYHDQARRIWPSHTQQIVAPDNAQENAIRCHEQLKTVEYRGYAGCAIAAELASCLAQHAPNLQRFVFYTRRPETIENPRTVCTSEYGDRMTTKRSVIKHLVKRIQGTQSRVNVAIL
nr:PREDICTED: putative F-box/FBD/LRR-repeat protein At5g62970 [Daucus carota subsp. sativus]